ncbi:5-(carboxyamino)imidazole ribonucleotide synthase [Oceanicola sp. 502str15]|uniref:5-(carboxyamino)imidazole ribonucleotide synthase n=1 Tax=Oceanicola sp. 502str15 TaxID=2696061 RepID=UPI0020954788|nr:5-(carboxyamino)imidazole ribonucleotide synthase [Oceanicola sp. 502str15]MCO6385172.1 5-(carboxyamino)imidazole ribonucleotide synthase [Oceanicola sp. 502str15]
MSEPLAPGSVIGILGGGQLGRMLSVAAARLGYRAHIFEPGAAPAGDVAARVTQAGYDDEAALRAFAESVDVITYEFENIPTAALDVLEAVRPIRPGREALRVSQDRLTEKEFLRGLGLETAPFAAVASEAEMAEAVAAIGAPSILKTRRLGYDGKGQARLKAAEDAPTAWAAMEGAEAVLEGFVDFSLEVSVIAARGLTGEVVCFDLGENLHKSGILATTTVPAKLPPRLAVDASLMAGKILNALDYVGVMGVELFVTPGALIVNEIAPRVHNSGHWTQNGCTVDQFEQHIRAVAGWPLGDGKRHSDVEMENLIGDDILRVPEIAREAHAALHLYGKAEARAGRKMGHVNRVKPVTR